MYFCELIRSAHSSLSGVLSSEALSSVNITGLQAAMRLHECSLTKALSDTSISTFQKGTECAREIIPMCTSDYIWYWEKLMNPLTLNKIDVGVGLTWTRLSEVPGWSWLSRDIFAGHVGPGVAIVRVRLTLPIFSYQSLYTHTTMYSERSSSLWVASRSGLDTFW